VGREVDDALAPGEKLRLRAGEWRRTTGRLHYQVSLYGKICQG
jgi:hypothetical protein